MKHEYHERPKAGENFKKLTRAAFQVPRAPYLDVGFSPKSPNSGNSALFLEVVSQFCD
jgi:hypothetical protein